MPDHDARPLDRTLAESPKRAFKSLSRAAALAVGKGESPKGFFRLLQSDYRYFHRMFASRLTVEGFEVRRVKKRANRNVWGAYLRRGSVLPGTEQEIIRRVICGVLASFGVKYPLREVDVSPRGDRMNVAFIFERGMVGSLSFFKGDEKWCSDPWP